MYLKAISKYKPPSPLIIKLILIYNYLGLYLEGQFNGGFFFFFFCVTSLGGLYLEGLIFGILRYIIIALKSALCPYDVIRWTVVSNVSQCGAS